MIITSNKPYTAEQVKQLRELFDVYIKTVIDIKRKICSAGCDRHFQSERTLIDSGGKQSDLWGGGIDLETKVIDCNAFINIRPGEGNTSNEIQDQRVRKKFEQLMKYFFSAVL